MFSSPQKFPQICLKLISAQSTTDLLPIPECLPLQNTLCYKYNFTIGSHLHLVSSTQSNFSFSFFEIPSCVACVSSLFPFIAEQNSITGIPCFVWCALLQFDFVEDPHYYLFLLTKTNPKRIFTCAKRGFRICFAGSHYTISTIPSSKSGTAKLLSQELHSAPSPHSFELCL